MSDRPHNLPNLPLQVVLKACPDILPYANQDILHWHHLVKAAELVRPMMGISLHAWGRAVEIMGAETAAITMAGILQRYAEIQSPGDIYNA